MNIMAYKFSIIYFTDLCIEQWKEITMEHVELREFIKNALIEIAMGIKMAGDRYAPADFLFTLFQFIILNSYESSAPNSR